MTDDELRRTEPGAYYAIAANVDGTETDLFAIVIDNAYLEPVYHLSLPGVPLSDVTMTGPVPTLDELDDVFSALAHASARTAEALAKANSLWKAITDGRRN